ncbi:hypothetical protein PVK06_019592 [Gossypium arboreum]|uniref:Aminotransferase-like plant mobile domain-containing protein n=1 Tax=Gossypium arboreum TaxID=29729 RepID=A0ABR0PKB0_GOSAR|nr:hypothetical protein PVK06_019592 [Gossypium arboreum]
MWQPEMHIFYLPCSERTITLEDVQLQLGLLVDGSVVTRLVYIADWRDVWEELLRRVLEMIYKARIDLNWLRRNFGRLNKDSTEVQREQHARAYILMIIGGLLMLYKPRNLVHLRSSMFGAPTESPIIMSSEYGTQYSYASMLMVLQTPPRSLFYQASQTGTYVDLRKPSFIIVNSTCNSRNGDPLSICVCTITSNPLTPLVLKMSYLTGSTKAQN